MLYWRRSFPKRSHEPKTSPKHMKNMRIGTRILAGDGLALLVVAAVGIVVYRGMTELVDAADWVTHTYKVKAVLSDFVSVLRDAETGQRGFLLTGEERYLEPYSSAITLVDNSIQKLRELTADNPNREKRIAMLQSLAASKL